LGPHRDGETPSARWGLVGGRRGQKADEPASPSSGHKHRDCAATGMWGLLQTDGNQADRRTKLRKACRASHSGPWSPLRQKRAVQVPERGNAALKRAPGNHHQNSRSRPPCSAAMQERTGPRTRRRTRASTAWFAVASGRVYRRHTVDIDGDGRTTHQHQRRKASTSTPKRPSTESPVPAIEVHRAMIKNRRI